MRQSRTHTTLIILVLVGIGVTAMSVAGYWWLFLKVRSTVSDITLVSEEAQLLAVKNAHTQTIRRIVRDTANERAQLSSYFISEKEVVDLLEDIEALSTDTGAMVTIGSVGVGNAIDKDGLVIPLSLVVESTGTLQQVYHTLALLEVFPNALYVGDVHVVQNPDTLLWRGSFEVTVIESNQ